MANDPNEVNTVKYPGDPDSPKFDTIENWPATTQVTQNTGEDITRNRDALLILERILGPNPHIGLFTSDLRTASVSQRLSILEQGVSEGRFEFKRLKVVRAIDTIIDVNQNITLALGAIKNSAHEYTTVEVRGPLHVLDSKADDPRAKFDVGFVVEKTQVSGQSTESEIKGSSLKNKPLLTITDYNRTNINDRDHTALRINGNLFVDGYIDGNFALDHARLNGINTDPVIDAKGNVITDAIHVTRGNFHTHKRGAFDLTLGRWMVDANPLEATYGIINHNDLEPISTRTNPNQENFIPNPKVAYHVTGGDTHDHTGGDGAPLRHQFLLGVDPKTSNHVTNGDFHNHDPNEEDGAPIPTSGVILEEDLEEDLQDLSTDSTGDPVIAEESLSSVLTRINNRFLAIDSSFESTIENFDDFKTLLDKTNGIIVGDGLGSYSGIGIPSNTTVFLRGDGSFAPIPGATEPALAELYGTPVGFTFAGVDVWTLINIPTTGLVSGFTADGVGGLIADRDMRVKVTARIGYKTQSTHDYEFAIAVGGTYQAKSVASTDMTNFILYYPNNKKQIPLQAAFDLSRNDTITVMVLRKGGDTTIDFTNCNLLITEV